MSLPDETTVFICGAGPTGLSLAIGLRLRGVPFVLCDRLAEGQNTSRAASIHARTLERLKPLGVSERLVSAGNPAPTLAVSDGGTPRLTIDLSVLKTEYPYALILAQHHTEAVLRDRLTELGGAVAWRHEVVGFVASESSATITVRDAEGGSREVRARFLAGTDGFHSTVRQAAVIPFSHGTYAQSFILGDVEAHWPLPSNSLQVFIKPAGLMVAVPFAPGHLRIVATCDEAPEHPSLDDLRQILADCGPAGARFDRLLWSSRFRVHHGVATRFRDGPILLAGDAAHVHSPAGGQGMNIGIQDAVRLAECLADAICDGRPDALDAYERERRPVAESVVRMTDRMTRIGSLKGPVTTALRGVGLRVVGAIPGLRHAIARQIAELDY